MKSESEQKSIEEATAEFETSLEELVSALENVSIKNYQYSHTQRIQRREVKAKKRKQRQKKRRHKNRK